MAVDFDTGYDREPYRTLCREYPDSSVYSYSYFRTEWGPIFHRGRLDGSAKILVIGQDPAQHENVVRRILVGAAGQRTQGFLAKLGIDTSYVMINTFLYSVYGQTSGTKLAGDPSIAAYRNQWLSALLSGNDIQCVIALGGLADGAWKAWQATADAGKWSPVYAHITHPTAPESSAAGNPAKLAAAFAALLANWNAGLNMLKPALKNPDAPRPLVPYGKRFRRDEIIDIPEGDVPAGLPAWMRGGDAWANRVGRSAVAKRATVVITVPSGVITS